MSIRNAALVICFLFLQLPRTLASVEKNGIQIFSKKELEVDSNLFLSICGRVFDVQAGERFYGPDGMYSFFGRRDATLAFAIGDFAEENRIDDISNINGDQCIVGQEWLDFFLDHKVYKQVGVLDGYFYNEKGEETIGMQNFKDCLQNGKQVEEANKPPECEKIFIRESDKKHVISCKDGFVPRKSHFTAGDSVNIDGTPSNINIISCQCLEVNEAKVRHDLQLYHEDCDIESSECAFINKENDFHN
jgi:hypothetical protein